jgi:hypothetical protein
LFLERSLSLVKDGGRLGLVLPSGLGSDAGAAGLRRAMFDRTGIDSLVSLDNRDGIFPVHRSLRILLFTATTGRRTAVLPCRVGVADRDAIDRLPESGADPEAVLLPRLLLDKLGGGDLAIPKVQGARDLDILHAVTFSLPAIGDRDGWHIRFGRELNATDDRRHFHRASRGLPIIEGKHLMPFTVNASAAGLRIDRDLAATLVDPGRTFARRRLAYREVASATNRLTLIAAVLPAGTITTHTVSCLKDDLDDESQDYLCGVLNSFVANYLVRMRVNTHVSSGIIDRLPVPVPCHDDPRFREIAGLSRSIAAAARGGTAHAATADARARLQALTARSYALRPSHFEHILATFPLVPRNERDRAMSAYYDIVP